MSMQIVIVILQVIILLVAIYAVFVASSRHYEDVKRRLLYEHYYGYRDDMIASRVNRLIDREAISRSIHITVPARTMLIVPVREVYERTGEFDEESVGQSISRIFEGSEPENEIDGANAVRDSVAVIRGFHKRYCRIPPFCSRQGED